MSAASATAMFYYLKDCNPGESNVIERDGSVERVATGRLADAVVPVPVDAADDRRRQVEGGVVGERRPGGRPGGQRPVCGVRPRRLVAAQAAVDERRDLRALCHPAVGDAAAHEVAPVLADVIVRQIEPATNRCPEGDRAQPTADFQHRRRRAYAPTLVWAVPRSISAETYASN